MVVESLLIVSVASLDLAIVPRCSRTNELVLDLAAITEYVKRMYALGSDKVSKFRTVIGLNDLGSIAEKGDGALYKIYSGVAAVFFVCIDKTLS